MSSPPRPLAGVRVLDCSTGIPGAYATKLWVDAGADVVKLEPPGGDPLRRWTASGQDLGPDEDGALFRFLNASKRSAVADLEEPSGRDLLLDLATGSDLVVEGSAGGFLAECGLGLDVLQARNPAVSLLSISPWGRSGPWAERPATEFTLQAWSGSTGYRGLPERWPVAAGGRIGEWAGGAYAALGGLAAWLAARRTGCGQHVDVSLFEVIVASMTTYPDLRSQFYGERHSERAIETPSIEPAADGWVGLCAYTGQQWKDFCLMIGRPEIAEDDRYYDATERMAHLAFIQEAMHAWTRAHTVDEIVELASALRIPVAPIGNGRSVLEMDHLAERGVFQKSPHGFLAPRVPYHLTSCDPRPFGPAPRLDEHGASVRAERAEPRPAREVEGGSGRPLEGVRIVDLTAFWAGPVLVTTLADLGADVVKVESIQRPDGMRFAGAVRNEILWEWSYVFHGANTSKRAITLNLEDERGVALLRRLVERADVLAENFSVRVMEHFGLGWETLHAWNPQLVMLRMPAWGLDGPWRDRTGFAANVEQASGLAWMTGYRDMPLIVRGACDPVGGMHAAFGLLMALEERRRTGEGQLVECPLVEPALNLAAEQVIEWTAYGALLERDENRGPTAAPQGVYRCRGADDWLAIAVESDAQWAGLCRALGSPAWARDPALADAPGRRHAHDAIDEELGRWCRDQEVEAATLALLAEGVPAAPVADGQALVPNPQLEARGYFQTLQHPITGDTRYPGLPMRFSAFNPFVRRTPAPTLGQHNDEVLRGDLGLGDAEIEQLRADKVIGERPAWLDPPQ